MAIALVVNIQTNPGQFGDFLERAKRHRETVLAQEPGCQRFDILEPEDANDRLTIYEVYVDQAALDAHDASAHMQSYREDVGSMIKDRVRNTFRLAN